MRVSRYILGEASACGCSNYDFKHIDSEVSMGLKEEEAYKRRSDLPKFSRTSGQGSILRGDFMKQIKERVSDQHQQIMKDVETAWKGMRK